MANFLENLVNQAKKKRDELAATFSGGRQVQTAPPEVQQKIATAKYGVLANSPQRQQQFVQSVQPTKRNVAQDFRSTVRNRATGLGLGSTRSIVGTAQGLSGLYDLATPGTGTNRFSKKLDTAAKFIDQTAEREGVGNIYKAGQVGTDLLSFAAPGAALKGLSKAPKVAKVVSPVTKGVTATNKRIDKAAAKLSVRGAGGRIAATGVQSLKPANVANMAVGTGLDLGTRSGKGQDISGKDVAISAGMNAGLGIGLPVATRAGIEGVKTTNANIPRTVYRGAPKNEPVNFVTQNKKMAEQFAEETGGSVQKYKVKPKEIFDISNPDHEYKAVKLVGQKKVDELKSRTPSGKFSPDDELTARRIAKRTGFKAVKFDEREVGRTAPRTIAKKPDSIGVIDEDVLGDDLHRQQKGSIRVGSGGRDPSRPLAALDEAAAKASGKPVQAPDSLPQTTPAQPKLETAQAESGQTVQPKQQSVPFDTSQYIAEQTKLQKEAAKGKTSKLGALRNEIATKGIDSLTPIEKPVEKVVGREGNLKLRNQLDRSLRSNTIAGQYAKDNGLHDVIQSVPDTKAFDQYLIAKHAQDLEANNVKTGRDLANDQALVGSLSPQYEAAAQNISKYNNSLLDKTVEYGLITKDTADYLKQKYPNYVPFDRIFTDAEMGGKKGNGAGPASLSKQTVIQRIQGSERQINSPLENILAKTHDVVAQGERNLAAKEIIATKDLPGNPLELKPLRTAADVMVRQDAYKQIAELKPARQYLKRSIADTKRQIVALGRKNKDAAAIVDSKVNDLTERIKAAMAEGQQLTGARSKKFNNFLGTVDQSGSIENLADAFLHIEDPAFRKQVAKVMTQDLKLGSLARILEDNASQLDTVLTKRKELFDEAKLHADAAARGKATISFINNGIKEIYETTPEVAAAAKSLNKEQLGLVGKILSYPTRALRLGATGINVAFTAANVVKDTASAAINSQHPFRASVANPNVFMKALSASFYHRGQSYAELTREGAGGTSFDIARNAAEDTVKKIRAQRNVGTKALFTVTHPGELLRAVEDTIGRSEEFGRAVQYFGNKEAALKSGKGLDEAIAYGADAARNNTINFARAGEYGRVLNSVLPYFNAGVQGSRTLMRNFRDRPIQTTSKIVIGSFVPVAAVTAWNLDSPERKEAYDDIPDYEKHGNIIIVPPNPKKDANGRWNVIKIPVSQEVASLNNVVRNGVETLHQDANFDFKAMATELMGTATSLKIGSTRDILNQVVPQAVKPAIETATNQNLFTGNKLVPDSKADLLPKDQYGDGTSGTARVLGSITNSSPYKIDNAIRTSFAGAGQNAVNASDNVLAKLGMIQPTDVKGTTMGTGIAKRFYSAAGGSGYDSADKILNDSVKQLTSMPEFNALSQADKAKALGRLKSDITATEVQKYDAKYGTGQYAADYTGKDKKLSKNQTNIVTNGLDIKNYLSGASTTTGLPKNYDKLDDGVKKFYDKKLSVSDTTEWSKQAVDESGQDLLRRASQARPQGFPDLPNTNEVASLYADYKTRQEKEKWTPTRENTEKLKMLREAYKSEFSDQDQYWLKASDANIADAIDNKEISPDLLGKLIAYDDLQTKLRGTAAIGNKIRRALGYGDAPKVSSGGSGKTASSLKSGKRGGRSKLTPADFKLPTDILTKYSTRGATLARTASLKR